MSEATQDGKLSRQSLRMHGSRLLGKLLEHAAVTYFQYLWMPERFDSGVVVKKLTDSDIFMAGLSDGHWLEVKVEWYRDCQTLYAAGYRERRGYLKVSRRFYDYTYVGLSLHLAYRQNRSNRSRQIRCRIAN